MLLKFPQESIGSEGLNNLPGSEIEEVWVIQSPENSPHPPLQVNGMCPDLCEVATHVCKQILAIQCWK